jgi:hypothetical protein
MSDSVIWQQFEKKEVYFGHNIPADYIGRIPEHLIG